jgi:hypothetical protein
LGLVPIWCPESSIPTPRSSLAEQRFELGQAAGARQRIVSMASLTCSGEWALNPLLGMKKI